MARRGAHDVGGVESFLEALAGRRCVLLDTMVFSYHFSAHPRYLPLTTALLDQIEAGKLEGLITTVTLAEVLAAPARAGNGEAMYDYEMFLVHFPHLRMVPLDVALARETARVRAETHLRFPDAVQVAAGRLAGADALVTNDLRWSPAVSRPPVLFLQNYAG
ncbi:MAG: type II toxin-antitoxin system VapC family toxin [Chloroflexia bacterium]